MSAKHERILLGRRYLRSHLARKCRHRWALNRCVYGPFREDGAPVRVEVCARCAQARIVISRDGEFHQLTSYAETLEEALLGRPLFDEDIDRAVSGLVMS